MYLSSKSYLQQNISQSPSPTNYITINYLKPKEYLFSIIDFNDLHLTGTILIEKLFLKYKSNFYPRMIFFAY